MNVEFRHRKGPEGEANAIIWDLYVNESLVPGFLVGLRRVTLQENHRSGRRPQYRIAYFANKNKKRTRDCFFKLYEAKYELLNKYYNYMLTNSSE